MKIYKLIFIISLILGMVSCTDFETLNQNPTVSNDLNPNMQLTSVIVSQFSDINTYRATCNYLASFSQIWNGAWELGYNGGRFFKNDEYGGRLVWQSMYQNQIKNCVDLIERTKEDPKYKNVNAIARIFKAYMFTWLTDVYGDIPYSEAGLGKILRPKYDKQEDIYRDIFKELDEAIKQFDSNSLPVTGDPIYRGNVEKWKSLANSMRLRYGLRVMKADLALSKQQVSAAISHPSGLISSSSDDAIIDMMNFKHLGDDRTNAIAGLLNGFSASIANYGVCSTLFNYMESTNDPRTWIYGRCYTYVERPNMPVGTDITDILKQYSVPGYTCYCVKGRGGYYWSAPYGASWLIPETVLSGIQYMEPMVLINAKFRAWDMPAQMMTYAETEFLLADALFRWPDIGIKGTVKEHYELGVRASMKYLERYKVDPIPLQTVNSFLNDNPLVPGKELEQINTQLWVLHFFNPNEAYANWRRSGYPQLQFGVDSGEVPMEASSIPRRMTYPLFEIIDNKENLIEALSRMGGKDDWESRVWWDKQ